MQPGRRIGFDYGRARIGVAASDFLGLIASPIATLQASDADLALQIRRIFEEYEPIYIVVGEPRHLSGRESTTMSDVESFISLLESLTSAPIHRIDERLSTVSAARTLRESGKDAKASKGKIDAMAAVAILESAMAKERISGTL